MKCLKLSNSVFNNRKNKRVIVHKNFTLSLGNDKETLSDQYTDILLLSNRSRRLCALCGCLTPPDYNLNQGAVIPLSYFSSSGKSESLDWF